jgi:hypothetical protein
VRVLRASEATAAAQRVEEARRRRRLGARARRRRRAASGASLHQLRACRSTTSRVSPPVHSLSKDPLHKIRHFWTRSISLSLSLCVSLSTAPRWCRRSDGRRERRALQRGARCGGRPAQQPTELARGTLLQRPRAAVAAPLHRRLRGHARLAQQVHRLHVEARQVRERDARVERAQPQRGVVEAAGRALRHEQAADGRHQVEIRGVRICAASCGSASTRREPSV